MLAAGKPEFVGRRPFHALQRFPARGEFLLFAAAVCADDRNRTFVIAARVFVVEERDRFSVASNSGMTDPIDALEENLSGGIFQPPVAGVRRIADQSHLL